MEILPLRQVITTSNLEIAVDFKPPGSHSPHSTIHIWHGPVPASVTPMRYRRLALDSVLAALATEVTGVLRQLQTAEWTWRATAGCACGCMPGFISTTETGVRPVTIYATFTKQ